jgi:FAD/FMN-containing dehydrogenase
LLCDLYDALAPHGRMVAAGCGPDVGIAGLTLGGGLGILGRTHGLTSDQLVAAEVVLADGRVVDCDEHTHPDLFWALRGAGGGQLGVVTRLVLRTVPAPETTTLHLVWPHADGAALLEAWQRWSPDAPTRWPQASWSRSARTRASRRASTSSVPCSRARPRRGRSCAR